LINKSPMNQAEWLRPLSNLLTTRLVICQPLVWVRPLTRITLEGYTTIDYFALQHALSPITLCATRVLADYFMPTSILFVTTTTAYFYIYCLILMVANLLG
jgi:hypothetical protein